MNFRVRKRAVRDEGQRNGCGEDEGGQVGGGHSGRGLIILGLYQIKVAFFKLCHNLVDLLGDLLSRHFPAGAGENLEVRRTETIVSKETMLRQLDLRNSLVTRGNLLLQACDLLLNLQRRSTL